MPSKRHLSERTGRATVHAKRILCIKIVPVREKLLTLDSSGQFSAADLAALVDLLDYALSVNSEPDLERLWQRLHSVTGVHGAIFGISRGRQEDSAQSFDLVTYGIDPAWASIYQRLQVDQADPVVAAALQAGIALSWAQAARIALQANPQMFRKSVFRRRAKAYGLECGFVICKRSSYTSQSLSVTALTTGTEVPDRRQIQMCRLLLPHLNEIMVRQGFHVIPDLSQREIEVLRWGATGKSSWKVARILNISARTVKFHLRNIYRKLEVTNRSQAVAKALRLGLVEID